MILSLCQQACRLCMYGNDHGATIFGYVIGNVATMSMASDIAAYEEDKIGVVTGYMKEKYPKEASSQNYKLSGFTEHCLALMRRNHWKRVIRLTVGSCAIISPWFSGRKIF